MVLWSDMPPKLQASKLLTIGNVPETFFVALIGYWLKVADIIQGSQFRTARNKMSYIECRGPVIVSSLCNNSPTTQYALVGSFKLLTPSVAR
jgi:hypothetical protein